MWELSVGDVTKPVRGTWPQAVIMTWAEACHRKETLKAMDVFAGGGDSGHACVNHHACKLGH